MGRADTTSDSFKLCVQVFINTREHARNLVGDKGDVTPHFFRRGGHNMLCPPTFFSLGFVLGEVSKMKVVFVTFCVKSVSYPS